LPDLKKGPGRPEKPVVDGAVIAVQLNGHVEAVGKERIHKVAEEHSDAAGIIVNMNSIRSSRRCWNLLPSESSFFVS